MSKKKKQAKNHLIFNGYEYSVMIRLFDGEDGSEKESRRFPLTTDKPLDDSDMDFVTDIVVRFFESEPNDGDTYTVDILDIAGVLKQ